MVFMYQRHGKRIFDLIVAALLLVLLAPLVLLLSLLVRLKLGTPVLFRQERPGLHGQPFTLIKFRTMTDARDPTGNLLPDAERLTDFGRFLRRASLDELPELINVLRSEMSLVGPRPLLMKYLPYYSNRERRRFDVRPGVTGWAQTHGRNQLPWNERLASDSWYVDQQSLGLDLAILWHTIFKVMHGADVGVDSDLDAERREQGA